MVVNNVGMIKFRRTTASLWLGVLRISLVSYFPEVSALLALGSGSGLPIAYAGIERFDLQDHDSYLGKKMVAKLF